jgi:transposase
MWVVIIGIYTTSPKLPQNSVIVMDNASFHKPADSQQAGHLVEFLTPYSPDLNPIEIILLCFSYSHIL